MMGSADVANKAVSSLNFGKAGCKRRNTTNPCEMLLHGEFNVLEAEYVTSFAATGANQKARTDSVGQQLALLKQSTKTKPMLLIISLAGIKVCDCKGQSVHMAHSLRRISYATCSLETKQFAFLAREPKAHVSRQQCHVFKMKGLEQIQEMNEVIERTFRTAREVQAASVAAAERSARCSYISADGGWWQQSLKSPPPPSAYSQPVFTQMPADHPLLQKGSFCRDTGSTTPTHTVATPVVSSAQRLSVGCTHATRGCCNRSYNYICSGTYEVADSIADRLSLYKDCCGREERTDNSENGCPFESRRLSRTAQEVENYLCPVPCQSDASKVEVSDNKGELQGDQQIQHGEYGSSCTMPLRYQNDSPFRTAEPDPPPVMSPQRFDSLMKLNQKVRESTIQVVDVLKQVPWFQPDMQRERVIEILCKEDIGSFMVRNSSTHPGCFALSVKVPKFDNPTGIGHYLVQRTPTGGVKLKGLDKEWSSLTALVVHHTIMPELLPCTLSMPEGASRNPRAVPVCNDDYDNDKAAAEMSASASARKPSRMFSAYGGYGSAGDSAMTCSLGELKLK